MAQIHNEMVVVLVAALGREEAARVCRPVLYDVGIRFGSEARKRLRVRDSPLDLLQAVAIMYRVLGIDFSVTREKDEIELCVHRCQLASRYSADACLLLSALDEGFVQGLNPGMRMRFTQHMTEGHESCFALVSKSWKNGVVM